MIILQGIGVASLICFVFSLKSLQNWPIAMPLCKSKEYYLISHAQI